MSPRSSSAQRERRRRVVAKRRRGRYAKRAITMPRAKRRAAGATSNNVHDGATHSSYAPSFQMPAHRRIYAGSSVRCDSRACRRRRMPPCSMLRRVQRSCCGNAEVLRCGRIFLQISPPPQCRRRYVRCQIGKCASASKQSAQRRRQVCAGRRAPAAQPASVQCLHLLPARNACPRGSGACRKAGQRGVGSMCSPRSRYARDAQARRVGARPTGSSPCLHLISPGSSATEACRRRASMRGGNAKASALRASLHQRRGSAAKAMMSSPAQR